MTYANELPCLRLPRLTLRPMCVSDESHYCAWFSNAEIMEGIGPQLSRERARAGFHASLGMMRSDPPTAWLWIAGATDGDDFAGLFGVVMRGGRHEVGALLEPALQRRGYAYEALEAVCDFALSDLKVPVLYGHQLASNARSVGLMEKLGFHRLPSDPGWIDWRLEHAQWRADALGESELHFGDRGPIPVERDAL